MVSFPHEKWERCGSIAASGACVCQKCIANKIGPRESVYTQPMIPAQGRVGDFATPIRGEPEGASSRSAAFIVGSDCNQPQN
jgi:hypothetical protein